MSYKPPKAPVKNLFFGLTVHESEEIEREGFQEALNLDRFFDQDGPRCTSGLYETSAGTKMVYFEEDDDGYV